MKQKRQQLNVLLTDEELRIIKAAANRYKLPVSTFARMKLLIAIEAEMKRKQEVTQ